MKFPTLISAVTALTNLMAPTAAYAQGSRTADAGSVLRIACDGANVKAEITINGVFKGECPVDISVSDGTMRVRAVKKVDGSSERVFEEEIRMAAGTVKRLNVELSAPQLTAAARAEAAQREAERRAIEAARAELARLEQLEIEKKNAEEREAKVRADAEFDRQIEAGGVAAMMQLAQAQEKLSESQNRAAALKWYQRAAELGHPEAMSATGSIYLNAKDSTKNEVLAEQWFRKGVAAGDARSMNGLGVIYLSGFSGLPNDEKLGMEWILKAAEKGSTVAIKNLGNFYRLGTYGLRQSFAEALKWYRKGAELGCNDCMYSVGNAYFNGEGVWTDAIAALEWYEKAAALGNAEAMTRIAMYHAIGMGKVPHNMSEANVWYRKAAELGDASAMFLLANSFRYGFGVKKDLSQALAWARKSAALNYDMARQSVSDLEAAGAR